MGAIRLRAFGEPLMHMMDGMSWVMGGMGLVGVLLVVVLVLGIAALSKYLFGTRHH